MTLAVEQPSAASDAKPFKTVGDVLRDLGDLPVDRILLRPTPGTATEEDMARSIEVDDRLVELIEKTLVEKPMGDYEDLIAVELAIAIGTHVKAYQLGIMGGSQGMKRMRSGNVVSPDVTFTVSSRLKYSDVRCRAANPVAPDLSIEVLSPSNTKREMLRKRRELFASGTRLIWEFEPADRTVAVYTSAEQPDVILDAAATLTGGDVLPGFTLDLAPFWAQFDD